MSKEIASKIEEKKKAIKILEKMLKEVERDLKTIYELEEEAESCKERLNI